jgi:protein kinase-like protein
MPRARIVEAADAVPAMRAAAPTLPRLDRYEVRREIGRGGMAVVYLARQTDLDRDVALKELRLFDGTDASAARRFLQESRLGAALTHPNLVTVHDYFEQDGTPYIAMEHLPRGSLRRYVGHTSTAENVGVLEGLLAGLDHAARHGVVHRDIKPENVMVTGAGHVKIADFGIAKATRAHGQTSMTMTGVPVGTPAYMAPEQAVGDEVGPWTDLYSVGVMAWELFTGHLPFRDTASAVGVLLRNVNEAVPPADSVEPSVDPAISAWIGRLLVKDPRDRPRSAADAWDELEEIAAITLGSCWRRNARLREPADSTGADSPLTPAPFAASEETGDGGATRAPRPPDDATTDEVIVVRRVSRASVATHAGALAETHHGMLDEPLRTPVHRPPAARVAAPAVRPPLRIGAARAAAKARARARGVLTRLRGAVAAARVAPRATAVIAAVAVIAIVAGRLAGGAGGHGPDRSAVLAGGGLRLSVPAAWTSATPPPAIPGVTHAGALSAAADPSGRTGVAASVNTYHPPSLLSADTLDAVRGRLPVPVALRLGGGAQAYRYDRLRLAGVPGRVTIYAVPTTDWVAALACVAPAGAAARFAGTCDAVAATFRPTGATPVPVGPSRAFGDGVARTLDRLRRDATALERRLAAATTPGDQAAAARRLAHAYGEAAGTLDNLPDRVVDGIAVAGVSGGFGNAADAYDQLATAARSGDQAGYDRARAALAVARRDIGEGRRTLARAGYGTR